MLTGIVENLLNRNLPASPRARELCAQLRRQRLVIAMSGTPLRLAVESTGDSLQIRRDDGSDSQAQVEGTPINLIALAGAEPEALLQRGAVTIRGDIELAQRYRELALLLRPDFEEELSRLLGDAPAHQLMRFATGALAFGRRSASTTALNLAEYLAHERGDLVPRAEAAVFLEGVDRLREDVDRLEARWILLEQRLGSGAPDAADQANR
ncbi:MAG: SCP2 sterol-binding domain-containing protein [Sinobacteraceae bacterium]|nr:SCP2 sterol-binding domain-containing protein [Nevskiaceae bacterium]MCP5338708.1 SCP2 sterol-binding domain-containing protein [Nevskiaceae bacterium]